MRDEEIWALEESLWTGDAAHMAKTLDPACLMVFPPGAILDADAAVQGIDGTPRWTRVEMAGRELRHPARDIVVIAYRARGERDGEPPYIAWCSSTWRHGDNGWRLVQHQHTPAMS